MINLPVCLPPKVQKGVGLSRLYNRSIELQNSVARSINGTNTMISACENVSRNIISIMIANLQ